MSTVPPPHHAWHSPASHYIPSASNGTSPLQHPAYSMNGMLAVAAAAAQGGGGAGGLGSGGLGGGPH
jgi:hypothetical protein